LLGHINQQRLKLLIQKRFLARQSQDLDKHIEIPMLEFVRIRFTDPKHVA
jgi:hypothetical protein